METKVCSDCGVEKPNTREYFSLHKTSIGGLNSQCKKCHNTYSAFWAKKNPKKCYKATKTYRKTFRGYVCHLVAAIKQRCTNPNHPSYKHYGKRGICCCFTWKELLNWLTIHNIDPRGKNIHRVDNDGNYDLNNIAFMDGGLHTSLHQTKIRI